MQQRKLGVHGLVQELGAMEDGARSGMRLKNLRTPAKSIQMRRPILTAAFFGVCSMQAFLDAANKATLLTTRWQDVLFGAQLVASNDIVGAVGAKK